MHVRMRRVRAQARAAGIPPEVVQLVAGTRHVDARDLRAIAGRRWVDVQHSQRVVAGWIGIEQGDKRQRLYRRLHRHGRRGIKRLVWKQFRHLVPLLAVSHRAIKRLESRARRRPLGTLESF
jgi:hypothetical protein